MMCLNKITVLTLFCLIHTLQLFSQEKTLEVAASVIDSKTGEAIAFGNVYHAKSNRGTVTNVDGFFRFPDLSLQDTLVISYVGYGKQSFRVSTFIESGIIQLKKKVEKLNEFVVLSDNKYLYELLNRARKTQVYQAKTAKTYFELKTNINQRQVELLECYFNGEFKGYDVNKLQLKNGRIALAEHNNNLFISTETSKALSYHKLIDGNDYFPKNPLELGKSKMKKLFKLKLVSRFKSDDGDTRYVIKFTPKDAVNNIFSGRVWVDSASAHVIKITLHKEQASIHPLSPLKYTDTLSDVKIQLTKNFEKQDGQMYFASADFTYSMNYKNATGENYAVTTSAILSAYNYNSQFILPFFEFESSESHKDFKQITAVPYNEFFWRNMTEFRKNDLKDKDAFFRKHYSSESYNEFLSDTSGGVHVNMLFKGYLPWSENRLVLSKDNFLNRYKQRTGSTLNPTDMMNLEIQTYMDVNRFNDTTHVLLQNIYDPFQSYYNYPKTAETQMFFNIYFDLLEIEKQQLSEELNQLQLTITPAKVVAKFKAFENNKEELRKNYYRSVDRGNNTRQLNEWNEKVKTILNIDNIEFFKSLSESMDE